MSSEKPRLRRLSRRESLKWMSTLAGATTISAVLPPISAADNKTDYAPWPELNLKPVSASGYGTDPDLITPAPAPWPRIMSDKQLALSIVLADILIPRDDAGQSASEVGVVDVIDEWISAPYPTQQAHRQIIEPGLAWIDAESKRRSGKRFVQLTQRQQLNIVDDIAFSERPVADDLQRPTAFFSMFRQLVVGAYVTSPQGMQDLGYQGNVPIAGDYPGPTPEAMTHLHSLLNDLGLESPTRPSG